MTDRPMPAAAEGGENVGAPLLSSNDIALAATACSLAIAWHRLQPRSSFGRREIEKLTALSAKLQAAGDRNNPFESADDMPLDWGGDPIYGPVPARAGAQP